MELSLDNLSDSKLLEQYINGHEPAFREIVCRYRNSLHAFLRRFLKHSDLVEDVFQETFLQMHSSRNSFDLNRPLKPWLYTIAANKAKDTLRKTKRHSAVPISALSDSGDVSFSDVISIFMSSKTTPDDKVTSEETAESVRQMVSDMPENFRTILILAYFEQFSYKQMAVILSIPMGTVKSRLHTAVKHFAEKWKAATDLDLDVFRA
jgi:RNA polymerase sigma-70 factor (ECF subfamily)